MENRISLITLGVSDLTRSVDFYENGLKLPRQAFNSDKVAFFKLQSGQFLALFPITDLAEDACLPTASHEGQFKGMTLSHNVDTKEAVSHILNEARDAGGRIIKPPQEPEWGGLSGYFADPDGHAWEVAYPLLDFDA